jgi:asparagine synthase (glutamine-hydrolysing)
VQGADKFAPLSQYVRTWAGGLSNRESALNWGCAMDLMTYLPDDLMVKSDRASMAFGLELREPMLDHELIAHTLSAPVSWRYNRAMRVSKLPVRAALANKLGAEWMKLPKKGFTPPLDAWLKGPLKLAMEDAVERLESGQLAPLSLPIGMRSWKDCCFALNEAHHAFTWRLLCFATWLDARCSSSSRVAADRLSQYE